MCLFIVNTWKLIILMEKMNFSLLDLKNEKKRFKEKTVNVFIPEINLN